MTDLIYFSGIARQSHCLNRQRAYLQWIILVTILGFSFLIMIPSLQEGRDQSRVDRIHAVAGQIALEARILFGESLDDISAPMQLGHVNDEFFQAAHVEGVQLFQNEVNPLAFGDIPAFQLVDPTVGIKYAFDINARLLFSSPIQS